MFKLLNKIQDYYHSMIRGVKNIIIWLPVIWRDRDFDQIYLYIILHKKLSNMEKFFRSRYTWTKTENETADEIKEVKELISNIINNVHVSSVNVDTNNLFGFRNGEWFSDTDNPKYHEFMIKMDEAEARADADKIKAFELISKRIDGWWD